MGKNPDWYDIWRARGVCYICRRRMDDDDPRRCHTECERLAHVDRRTYAEIRQAPPALRHWSKWRRHADV